MRESLGQQIEFRSRLLCVSQSVHPGLPKHRIQNMEVGQAQAELQRRAIETSGKCITTSSPKLVSTQSH